MQPNNIQPTIIERRDGGYLKFIIGGTILAIIIIGITNKATDTDKDSLIEAKTDSKNIDNQIPSAENYSNNNSNVNIQQEEIEKKLLATIEYKLNGKIEHILKSANLEEFPELIALINQLIKKQITENLYIYVSQTKVKKTKIIDGKTIEYYEPANVIFCKEELKNLEEKNLEEIKTTLKKNTYITSSVETFNKLRDVVHEQNLLQSSFDNVTISATTKEPEVSEQRSFKSRNTNSSINSSRFAYPAPTPTAPPLEIDFDRNRTFNNSFLSVSREKSQQPNQIISDQTEIIPSISPNTHNPQEIRVISRNLANNEQNQQLPKLTAEASHIPIELSPLEKLPARILNTNNQSLPEITHTFKGRLSDIYSTNQPLNAKTISSNSLPPFSPIDVNGTNNLRPIRAQSVDHLLTKSKKLQTINSAPNKVSKKLINSGSLNNDYRKILSTSIKKKQNNESNLVSEPFNSYGYGELKRAQSAQASPVSRRSSQNSFSNNSEKRIITYCSHSVKQTSHEVSYSPILYKALINVSKKNHGEEDFIKQVIKICLNINHYKDLSTNLNVKYKKYYSLDEIISITRNEHNEENLLLMDLDEISKKLNRYFINIQNPEDNDMLPIVAILVHTKLTNSIKTLSKDIRDSIAQSLLNIIRPIFQAMKIDSKKQFIIFFKVFNDQFLNGIKKAQSDLSNKKEQNNESQMAEYNHIIANTPRNEERIEVMNENFSFAQNCNSYDDLASIEEDTTSKEYSEVSRKNHYINRSNAANTSNLRTLSYISGIPINSDLDAINDQDYDNSISKILKTQYKTFIGSLISDNEFIKSMKPEFVVNKILNKIKNNQDINELIANFLSECLRIENIIERIDETTFKQSQAEVLKALEKSTYYTKNPIVGFIKEIHSECEKMKKNSKVKNSKSNSLNNSLAAKSKKASLKPILRVKN